MLERRVLSVLVVPSAVILMSASWLFGAEQDPLKGSEVSSSTSAVSYKPEKEHGRFEELLKKWHHLIDFDAWPGKVRLTGKKVEKLPFDAASFRKWSESVQERHSRREVRYELTDPSVQVNLYFSDSPRRAADVFAWYVILAETGSLPGKRITEGKLFVGDVAFPMIAQGNIVTLTEADLAEWISKGKPSVGDGALPKVEHREEPGPMCGLAFVRNNVAVRIRAPERELIEELATFVDGKLVEALVPTDDPAFSHELEDPPAEGEAKSESEGENEEQAEAEK